MRETLLLVLTALGSIMATGALMRYALRRNLIDRPGARSSHSVPTPRGGGGAIVLSFAVSVLLAAWLWPNTGKFAAAALGGGIPVALVGFWDDHRHVSPGLRLAVHAMAAGWALTVLGDAAPLALMNGWEMLRWAVMGLAFLALIWLTNLYNFMDGIDGIAGGEAVSVTVCASLILLDLGHPQGALPMALLGAASLGFLVWNWPPAKVFMGDVGSGFVGFTLGVCVLWNSTEGWMPVWSWLILLGVFGVDASVTLLRRFLAGERLYQAHRSHAYQNAARRLGSHGWVSGLVVTVNVLWLFPMAWISARFGYGLLLMVLAWLPLVLLALRLGAGTREPHAALGPPGPS